MRTAPTASHVRLFRPDDAEALATIFHAAVHAIDRGLYSQRQLDAWSPAPPSPDSYLERAGDGRLLLVAVDDQDRPLAYGDLEGNGHLDHLYRDPALSARGAAWAVYQGLERTAREKGLARLFVEASEPARPFFLRQGFVLVARRDFDLRGVAIHNDAMEKAL